MSDMFPEGSVIRRVNIEPALLLGAGRALVLQLAHPIVARGVEEHSEFKADPFKRLLGTLEATYAVVFGSEELARAVGQRIHNLHDRVKGTGYRANAPENLMWVHATLVDTALRCYEDFVRPLGAADAETYYREMRVVAELFGVPIEEQPPSLDAFRTYFDDTVESLEVTDTGRALAEFVVDPVLPLGLHVPLRPLLRLQRRLTIGRLPPPLRAEFGFEWGTADSERLARFERRAQQVFRLLPQPVRTAGPRLNGLFLLWLARRHVGGQPDGDDGVRS